MNGKRAKRLRRLAECMTGGRDTEYGADRTTVRQGERLQKLQATGEWARVRVTTFTVFMKPSCTRAVYQHLKAIGV